MTEMTNFTQPDVSPTYFIDFLEFLDNHGEIKRVRAEFNKRMNLAIGDKVLDLGCGIGGATLLRTRPAQRVSSRGSTSALQ
jgi:ubiquinone/menaquinone biosynthesis C-methylase UbiE